MSKAITIILSIILISIISSIVFVITEDSSSWCHEKVRKGESELSLRNLICPLGSYR